MNLGVVTLNLPRIALEAQGSQEKFWQILNERLAIVKDALVYRVERVKEVKPANAPILYMYGAFGKRLATQDAVDELFKTNVPRFHLAILACMKWLLPLRRCLGGQSRGQNFTLDILKELKKMPTTGATNTAIILVSTLHRAKA